LQRAFRPGFKDDVFFGLGNELWHASGTGKPLSFTISGLARFLSYLSLCPPRSGGAA